MRRRLPAWVWAFAAVKIGFHVATTRLSFHRDELYFISASKRLVVSYVDFQPVTPVLLRLERTLFGDSLIGLRLIPAIAGAVVILLGALIARELGGDRRAQILAAFMMLVAPMFVGMNSTLNTVSLETPAWMLVALVTIRLLRTEDERLWAALGAAAGLALLVKFTMAAYLGALGIAVLATPLRRSLRSPWLWLGAAIGAAMFVPSVVWQFRHDFAVVEFVSNQGGGGAILGLRGRLGYLAGLIILPGIVPVLVYVPGLIWLWRHKTFCTLAIAHAVALVAFFVASGKGYYAFPAIAVLLCAGSVALMERRDRYPRAVMAGTAAGLLLSLLFVVPIAPISVYRDNPDLAEGAEIGERIGWDELARTVSGIYTDLPSHDRARTFMVGSNYTLPSAIEFYADDYDEPPAVSGHNSAYLWWPRLPRDHVAIFVGFDPKWVGRYYRDVRFVGRFRNSEGVKNYDWNAPICVARGPKVTPQELRELVKSFEA
ncbi:MAG TPA: glycosyltransferase family 39 protein [Actinomycetota bacterium]|jgi:4-amino-4-deoxy-L-arabinose transferase-like glycosyltransferase|nr:glycosyltransferase family 39 protein [Actinomycetota bacterium]